MKMNRFTQMQQHDASEEEFYNVHQVGELFENDELSADEEGFMSGYLRAR